MDLYQKTEQFVKESFENSGRGGMTHLQRTAFWVKRLYPKADSALLIAAVSHDIERAFRREDVEHAQKSEKGFLDEKHLKYHQEKGAEIIFNFLIKAGADKDFSRKVKVLIEKHEVGGTREQDTLRDADSVSFFENNADHFVKDKADMTGKEKVREKFIWMFDRIASPAAREIARPWYEAALKDLGDR